MVKRCRCWLVLENGFTFDAWVLLTSVRHFSFPVQLRCRSSYHPMSREMIGQFQAWSPHTYLGGVWRATCCILPCQLVASTRLLQRFILSDRGSLISKTTATRDETRDFYCTRPKVTDSKLGLLLQHSPSSLNCDRFGLRSDKQRKVSADMEEFYHRAE